MTVVLVFMFPASGLLCSLAALQRYSVAAHPRRRSTYVLSLPIFPSLRLLFLIRLKLDFRDLHRVNKWTIFPVDYQPYFSLSTSR